MTFFRRCPYIKNIQLCCVNKPESCFYLSFSFVPYTNKFQSSTHFFFTVFLKYYLPLQKNYLSPSGQDLWPEQSCSPPLLMPVNFLQINVCKDILLCQYPNGEISDFFLLIEWNPSFPTFHPNLCLLFYLISFLITSYLFSFQVWALTLQQD